MLQNTHLLEARCGYSRAESDALLALLGTQVVLSVESVGEAEEISKRLGDYSVKTTGQSSTKGTQSSSSGKSFSVARRPLITPSELMAWSARENGALVIDAEGPMALASRDITETFLGPLLGMTSPEAEGALLARARGGGPEHLPGTGARGRSGTPPRHRCGASRRSRKSPRGRRPAAGSARYPPRPTGSDASYGPACENGPPSYGARGAYDGGPWRSFGLSFHATSGNELGTPSCAAKSRAPVVRPYPAHKDRLSLTCDTISNAQNRIISPIIA